MRIVSLILSFNKVIGKFIVSCGIILTDNCKGYGQISKVFHLFFGGGEESG